MLHVLTKQATLDQKEFTVNLTLQDPDNFEKVEYLKIRSRLIATSSDRFLFYSLVENVSEQVLLEKKQKELTNELQIVMNNSPCGITVVYMDDNKKADILFVNETFCNILGFSKEEYTNTINTGLEYIHPDDVKTILPKLASINSIGDSITVKLRALRKDKSLIWLKISITVIKLETYEKPVQLSVISDISEEVEAESQLVFLNDCAHDILGQKDCDDSINKTLEKMLTYFDGDRAYVFEFNKEHTSSNNTYEVCKQGIIPEKDNLQNVPFEVTLPWYNTLIEKPLYSIEDVDKIPEDDLRTILQAQTIKSIILTSLWRNQELIGFVGVDNPTQSMNNIDRLRAISDYIAILVTRRDITQEIIPTALSAIMNYSTDMMFVKDTNLRYVSASPSAYIISGCKNQNEIMNKTDIDLFGNDLGKKYQECDKKVIETKTPLINDMDLIITKEGTQHSVLTSKFPIFNAIGQVVGLYGFSKDITKIKETESKLALLTNTIPGGLVSYEYKDKQLKPIYLNEGFFRAAGFTRKEYEELTKTDPLFLVHKDDKPKILKIINEQINSKELNNILQCECRCLTKSNGYKWYSFKLVVEQFISETHFIINAVLFDIDENRKFQETLRVSEEEYRLAAGLSNSVICKYIIADRTVRIPKEIARKIQLPEILVDVPYSRVKLGKISPDTSQAYIKFYENIIKGDKTGEVVYRKHFEIGWRWIESKFTTIFDSEGKPVSAVIIYSDITELREKEITFSKWQQQIKQKPIDSYTIFNCNIDNVTLYDKREGNLLKVEFEPGPFVFDTHTIQYANQYVFKDDIRLFCDYLNSKSLKEKFEKGIINSSIEYREKTENNEVRWIRLTVDLVKIPNVNEIEGHMLFEDIDKYKRNQLQILQRAQIDSLTQVLNRATFTENVNKIIQTSEPDTKHALLMLDIDNFKLVNDVFGHTEGDQTLIDIAKLLHSLSRSYDLVGRLGGDEFVVFLQNIPDTSIAAKRAKDICDKVKKDLGNNVIISASIGISVCPRDGMDFETLYKKADETLYKVKDDGKNNFTFYQNNNTSQVAQKNGFTENKRKPHILIVEDNFVDYTILENLCNDSYIIEKETNGKDALQHLKRYSHTISVVLLDLMMPGMNGFEFLEKIKLEDSIKNIPIIVVSSDESRETCLKAIRAGATDFITKPVNSDTLFKRIQSVISNHDIKKDANI